MYRAGLCVWSYVKLVSVYRAVYAYGSGPLCVLLLCVYVCGQVSKQDVYVCGQVSKRDVYVCGRVSK